VEVVASLSQGRTVAAQCSLFTHKSVPVIFEPPCIFDIRVGFYEISVLVCYATFLICSAFLLESQRKSPVVPGFLKFSIGFNICVSFWCSSTRSVLIGLEFNSLHSLQFDVWA